MAYRTGFRKFLLTGMAAIIASTPAAACTSFLLKTAEGGSIYGRTMEFGFELESDAVVIPRQHAYTSDSGRDGTPGLSWKTKYAAVGMNAFKLPVLTDGMNEKGLVGGILYFPNYAGYAEAADTAAERSLAPWEFLTWALTNFATVAEVKAALGDVSIVAVKEPSLGIVPPVHYTLHDATGASIVIEPIDGELKVYDNPLGVMTNAPTFDWHLTNLKNYVKLSPKNAQPLVLEGQTITSFGEGSGLLGIPGDATPPSRFIRALGYTMSAKPTTGGDKSVRLAEHILNNFDIPVGWIRQGEEDAEQAALEYTQWSTVADMLTLQYYVKTYDDQVLRGIDLMSFDLDAKDIKTATFKPNLTAPALVFEQQ